MTISLDMAAFLSGCPVRSLRRACESGLIPTVLNDGERRIDPAVLGIRQSDVALAEALPIILSGITIGDIEGSRQ